MVQIQILTVYIIFLAGAISVTLGFQLRTARTPLRTAMSSNRIAFTSRIQPETKSTITMSSSGRAIKKTGTKITEKQAPPEGIFNLVGASSKFFVSGVATFVLYTTDSWVPLYYIVGSVLCGVLSKGIKTIVKQPRPTLSDKDGYGMPSSHTQSFFFFLAIILINGNRFLSKRYSALLSLSIFLYSCVASYWRVVTNVHSLSQTFVGALVGLLFGLFVSKNELFTIGLIRPLIGQMGQSAGPPLFAKLTISTLGALVICKSEIKLLLKFLLKFIKNNLGDKRNSYEI